MHLGQLTARDGQTDDVAEELADGGVGGVADALEVGDQGGQAWAEQTTRRDLRRQRRLVGP